MFLNIGGIQWRAVREIFSEESYSVACLTFHML